jgi:hypothetical protein
VKGEGQKGGSAALKAEEMLGPVAEGLERMRREGATARWRGQSFTGILDAARAQNMGVLWQGGSG